MFKKQITVHHKDGPATHETEFDTEKALIVATTIGLLAGGIFLAYKLGQRMEAAQVDDEAFTHTRY
jgi:hypothetical protein